MTKANTAAVIAILNVNIRYRPLVHCIPETKIDRGATAQGLWRPTVCGIAEKRESQPRAVRLAFEPADFGQIAALKAGPEAELRYIEPTLPRATACWLCNFGRNIDDGRVGGPALLLLRPEGCAFFVVSDDGFVVSRRHEFRPKRLIE